MSVAVETGLELAHSTDLMFLYSPSNNPKLAETTLKDAGIHPMHGCVVLIPYLPTSDPKQNPFLP